MAWADPAENAQMAIDTSRPAMVLVMRDMNGSLVGESTGGRLIRMLGAVLARDRGIWPICQLCNSLCHETVIIGSHRVSGLQGEVAHQSL